MASNGYLQEKLWDRDDEMKLSKHWIAAIMTLVIVAAIKSFFLKEINHYESSSLYMITFLCMDRLLDE